MSIAVLMSTYNGETYLREQIDSILAQKGADFRLYIRDDGSTDHTCEILEEYACKYPDVIRYDAAVKRENLGVRKSFFALLKTALQNPEAEYFAFSDHDDVWFEDKLEAARTMLDQAGPNKKGRLYYSNKTITDENLNITEQEQIRFYDDFEESIWQSLASGCTMMFDRVLAETVLRHDPQVKCIHDNWIYRVAKSIGARVVFDQSPHMYYRQHETNAVGQDVQFIHHNSLLFMVKRFLPVLFIKRIHYFQQFYREIAENYGDMLDPKAADVINSLMKYRFNPYYKLKLIGNRNMRKRPVKTRAIWAYKILFNRL